VSNLLPSEAIANEVFGLDLTPKAMLLNELTDSVLETQEGLKILNLSSDATQWVKSLTTSEALTIIQCLAHSLCEQLRLDQEQEKLEDAAFELSFGEYRIEQGYEDCPCGDMDVYSCAGECGWGDAA